MTVNQKNVNAAAQRLAKAAHTGRPCEPVRDLIGRDDLDSAYAVQGVLTARRVADGEEVVGRKIGLTSLAVQQQLGVDRPDFGVLFGSMGYADGATIVAADVMQPRVEAEIAFVLGADLVDGPLDAEQVRAATDHVVAALEVCGSRVRDWDISFGDTVADNASGAAFVLGTDQCSLDEVVPADIEMTMSIDGEEASTGNGAACLGDPVEAVVWLARTAREVGEPLRAGQIILSGALGPMRPVVAGQRVTATLSGLGTVSVGFA